MVATVKGEVSVATADDLPRMGPTAEEFYAASRFLKGFDLEKFSRVWRDLLKSGTGAIFKLSAGEEIVGAIGGVVYPDINSGAAVATEFFWYVKPEFRGQGLELYRAFELWARKMGAEQLRMMFLTDSMPERLDRVYRRLGFEPAEVMYVKELS